MGPIAFPPFVLEARPLRLRKGAELVPLRRKVLGMLAYLASRPGRAIPKEELLEALWPGLAVSDAAVKVCIRELRHALGDDARRSAFVATDPDGAYRFVARIDRAAGDPVAAPAAPLVGRSQELAALSAALDAALAGRRRIALVRGEAGIGKTALVEAFLAAAAEVVAAAGGKAAIGRCDATHGASEPFSPFLEAMGRAARGADGRAIVRLLREHAPSWLLQLPGLLRPEERVALLREYASATRERMLRELVVGLEAITEEIPLVVVLEDLHWADPGTHDLLAALARRRDPARLLAIATHRPGEAAAIDAIAGELRLRGAATEIELGPLAVEDVDRLLASRISDRERVASLAAAVHRHTGGHPLFVVHVADEVAASGELAGVPERLREIVAAQMERLSPEHRLLLDAACVIGLEFSVAEVAAAIGGDVADVERGLADVARTARFVRPLPASQHGPASRRGDRGLRRETARVRDLRFAFAHVFHRDLCYEALPPRWRARTHARVARALAREAGGALDLAAEVAHHFERAGDASQAVAHLEVAAESAIQRHADHAAAEILGRALALLEETPPGVDRDRTELRLRSALGPALLNTRGFASAEVEACYRRALQLCRASGESAELFPVLEGLQSYFSIRGPLAEAHALSRRMDRLARRTGEPLHRIEADHVLGCDLVKLGRFAAACRPLERAVRNYRAAYADAAFRLCGHDPKVCCLAQLAVARWFLGDPEESRRAASAGLEFAADLRQPMTIALARFTLAWIQLLCGESRSAAEQLSATVALADAEGLPYWSGLARLFLGWALAASGDRPRAARLLGEGREVCRLVGPDIGRAEHALLAVRSGVVSRREEALALLDEAAALLRSRGERYLDPEIDLLRAGVLLRSCRGHAGARRRRQGRALLRRALDRARELGSPSYELRASLALARCWARDGRSRAVADLLGGVVARFPASADTADLRRARRVLRGLGAGEVRTERSLGARRELGRRAAAGREPASAARRA